MTKTEWLGLTGKQQWDVIVALRGPDSQPSESIKWVTTAVIRWAMHTVMRVGGTVNDSLKCVIVPNDLYGLDKLALKAANPPFPALCWSHFFNHVREAAAVCEIPVYGLDNSTYFAATNNPALTTVCLMWQGTREQALKDELERYIKHQTGRSPETNLKLVGVLSPEEDSQNGTG